MLGTKTNTDHYSQNRSVSGIFFQINAKIRFPKKSKFLRGRLAAGRPLEERQFFKVMESIEKCVKLPVGTGLPETSKMDCNKDSASRWWLLSYRVGSLHRCILSLG